MKKEIFDPLGLESTALGSRGLPRERLVRVEIPEYQIGTDFGWNSTYWMELGAPWALVFSTPQDFARICRMMLSRGTYDGVRLLSPRSVEMMTTNRLDTLPEVPEPVRRTQPWALGWQMNHPGTPGSWSDLLGRDVFGHTGGTGTMVWMDPRRRGFCIIFTTAMTTRVPWLTVHLSNVIASAFE